MTRTHREIRTHWFVAMWAKPFDAGWFRIFGVGLGLADHRQNPPLFSERYGKKRYLHLGPWCIRTLSR